ncbi:MAG: low molecular weight phosphatase family protein [Sphingomonadales bacterium]
MTASDPSPDLPRSVLFLCNQNAVRSPIAEALLTRAARGRLYVDSVGLHCAPMLDPFSVAVMAELGIDLADYPPKGVDDLRENGFELVIALTPEAHDAARSDDFMPGAKIEYWPTMNPSLTEGGRETVLSAYRAVRDQLARRIAHRFGFSAAAIEAPQQKP